MANANPPATSEEATSRWDGFRHKREVLGSLLREQYSLCCYSEIRADEVGIGFHVEHVENKGQAPVRTFDYSNLGASGIESSHLCTLTDAERFGGHAPGKRKAVDTARFVSCHQVDCRRYFHYVSDGRVVEADGLSGVDFDRAHYTIELLNLNSPYLTLLRRKWWDEISDLILEHEQKGWDLHQLASIDLIPSGWPDPVLSRFFSVSRQLYSVVGENVIDANMHRFI